MNLLFITADQWRGDALSALGHPVVKTPNLDSLAREGVLFAAHYANTSPCSPSRASLYTGLYQHNHRVVSNGTPLADRHTNWARELVKAGREPWLIGCTDQTPDPAGLPPDDPRLRTYEGLLPGIVPLAHVTMERPGPWGEALRARGYELPADEWAVLWQREPGPDYEDGAPAPKPWFIRSEDTDTAWSIDSAIAATAPSAAPWSLHLSLLRPHPPWIAAEPWNTRYDPAAMPASINADGAAGIVHPWLTRERTLPLSAAPRDPRKLNRMKALYFALMSEVDHHLGRLFAHLKATGQWETTFIVFTSDHGEMLGDHGILGKDGFFEAAYHVPLIIRDPRSLAASGRDRICEALSESVDLLPTMLEALGLTPPPTLDGQSLAPLLAAPSADTGRAAIHIEFDFRDLEAPPDEAPFGLSPEDAHLTIRRERHYKFVHFAGLPPLLFDLQNDPHELDNLAEQPGAASLRLAMVEALLAWRTRTSERAYSHLKATPSGLIQR